LSVLVIMSTMNIKYLALLIDDKSVLISEHLPPSWVRSFSLHVAVTSIAVDGHWVSLVGNWLQCSAWIKHPLLLSSIHLPLSDSKPASTLVLNNSVGWESWDNVEWSVDVEAEVLIKSLGLSGWIICVDNSPSLVGIVVSLLDTDGCSFLILGGGNIKASIGLLDVTEVLSLECEDLPPSWVSAPDLHVVGSSWASDVPWLIVQSGSDSQGRLMEVPDLSSSLVGCLDHKVSIADQVKISSWGQGWDNVEVFINDKTEVFVHLSLGWLSLPFINIDDIPLLVDSSMLWMSNDISVLRVNSSSNIKYLTLFVGNECSLVSE
jgi:hypothetical protein